MKTPEQMAKEYGDYFMPGEDNKAYTPLIKEIAFLAGYKAAKDEMNSPKNSDSSDNSDTPDLQEQIEALQQYMTVAQRKIMALQSNVNLLLYLSRDKMRDEQALRRMDAVMKGFGRNNE